MNFFGYTIRNWDLHLFAVIVFILAYSANPNFFTVATDYWSQFPIRLLMWVVGSVLYDYVKWRAIKKSSRNLNSR